MQAVAGAFILLILLCLLGVVLLTGLIFLIVGMVRRNKTNRKYPKVFIVIGVLIWIPFLGMIIYIVIDDRMLDQKEKMIYKCAYRMNGMRITKKLIENGADINCKNNYGETIWDLIDFYKIDSTRQMLYDIGYREDE